MAVDDTVLGCGRTVEAVWANMSDPPTPHEVSCEQCRAARGSLRALQQFTSHYREAEYRAQEQPEAVDRPSPTVRSTVMAIARAEVRRGRRIPIATTDLGPILISEQALLALVRVTLDSVDGMRARRVSTTGILDTFPVRSEETDREVRISCRVAVAPGVGIPAAASEARNRVGAAILRSLNVMVDAVDIIVEDLYGR